jgi:hypothetical protein
MKFSRSDTFAFIAVAAAVLAIAYTLFASSRSIAPPVSDNNTASTAPSVSATASSTGSPPKIEPESETEPTEQGSAAIGVTSRPSEATEGPAVAESDDWGDQAYANERQRVLAEENGLERDPYLDTPVDTSVPPPTDDNIAAKPKGEYFNQIDQQAIFDQAEADGFLEGGAR